VNLIAIILVSLLFTALFSGLETAFQSADKIRLEFIIQSGPLRGYPLKQFISRPGNFFTTLLIGYYLSLLAFCLGTTLWLEPVLGVTGWAGWLRLPAIIAVTGAILLLFGEYLPQVVFRISPHTLLILLAWPFFILQLVLYPLIWIINSLVSLSLRYTLPSKSPGDKESGRIFTMIGLDHFFREEDRRQDIPENKVEKEVILLRNALDFSRVKLHEIMVPRNEIAVLDVESDIETLKKKFIETGFSRILLFEGNIDYIVGYIHSSAIFQKATTIKPFLKSVLFVPESMAANRLLSKFIRERRSIALVVDEFGGTSGLVTSEDILEEIFGEIEDEYDTSEFTGRKVNDRQYIFSGRFEIDALNERYNLHIPESDEYETLAGFILCHSESIPKVNSTIRIGRLSFKILKATLTKIELVQLTYLES
jgi:CBS domain containing-hemolysin-like protein